MKFTEEQQQDLNEQFTLIEERSTQIRAAIQALQIGQAKNPEKVIEECLTGSTAILVASQALKHLLGLTQ